MRSDKTVTRRMAPFPSHSPSRIQHTESSPECAQFFDFGVSHRYQPQNQNTHWLTKWLPKAAGSRDPRQQQKTLSESVERVRDDRSVVVSCTHMFLDSGHVCGFSRRLLFLVGFSSRLCAVDLIPPPKETREMRVIHGMPSG